MSQHNPTRRATAQNDLDVLIIGAGAAGLAAGRLLYEWGYNLLILEGRERIGGRIWTDRSLGLALDLGASWIQGVEDNPVTELAANFGIKTIPTDYDALALYDSAGQKVDEAEAEQIDEITDALLSAIDDQEPEDDRPLGSAIQEALAKMDLSADETTQVNYILSSTIEHEFAADVNKLSLFYWDDSEAFDGEDVIFPNGYDQIINGLATDLPIQTGYRVQRVEYGDDGVTVFTDRGLFEADYALVTVPLGVLKAGNITFSPPLPSRKSDAIQRLGMGVLNKCYLRFPAAFWDQGSDLLGFIPQAKGQWVEFLNIYKYTGSPILLGFNADSFGREIEIWTDEDIVASAMQTLRIMYGNEIPAPDSWLVTRWGSDPFALGSYSFYATGSTPEDIAALAAPVMNRLFFAGEATSEDYPSTVHGALLSGYRAAEEIDTAAE